MIPWLEAGSPNFPPAESALNDPNGLLAAGGELTPEWLLYAYQRGIFPWFEDESLILWWSPAPRMILTPEQVHVSRSLRKLIRQNKFQVTIDLAFDRVISACAHSRPETWILPVMVDAYCELHRLGHAHSVEVWAGDELVGGLYGIGIGRMFFGESMFSCRANASKVALVALAQHCLLWGIEAIDCQMHTVHLQSMGAQLKPRDAFSAMLKLCHQPSSANWQLNPHWQARIGKPDVKQA